MLCAVWTGPSGQVQILQNAAPTHTHSIATLPTTFLPPAQPQLAPGMSHRTLTTVTTATIVVRITMTTPVMSHHTRTTAMTIVVRITMTTPVISHHTQTTAMTIVVRISVTTPVMSHCTLTTVTTAMTTVRITVTTPVMSHRTLTTAMTVVRIACQLCLTMH